MAKTFVMESLLEGPSAHGSSLALVLQVVLFCQNSRVFVVLPACFTCLVQDFSYFSWRVGLPECGDCLCRKSKGSLCRFSKVFSLLKEGHSCPHLRFSLPILWSLKVQKSERLRHPI